MHTIKITPNLLFEYQCTSGKFFRLPNRIEKNLFGSENRIESKLFCPNWNALVVTLRAYFNVPTGTDVLGDLKSVLEGLVTRA